MARMSLSIGPSPRGVRPHEEAPIARRTAILALTFFFAAALALSTLGVDIGTLQRTFPLYALGGFSILIFGTSRLLIAGMAGRDIAGGATSSLLTTLPAAIGASGLFLTDGAPPSLRAAFALAWSAGALAHVVVTTLSVRRPPTRPLVQDPTAGPGSRIPLRILEAAALAYAAAAAALLPLAVLGRVAYPALVHVVLVGFVTVTIFGVGAHILPRFTRARIPTSLLGLLVLPAISGPALLALGLAGHRVLLAPGAIVEGIAFALFGAAVLGSIARSHRFRLPDLAYAAAPVAIAVGGLLALGFATRGAPVRHLAVHGVLNVFGFAGLFVMAASTDLYAPALQPGATPARRHAAVALTVTLAALVAAAAGVWIDDARLARGGMLLYAAAILWQLAGVTASHRRAGRIVARFRASR